MFFNIFSDSYEFFKHLITLSDVAFYNLLGLLLIIVFFRIVLQLHIHMTKELGTRNEVTDLAEEDGCSEFDIFVKSLELYGAQFNSKKAKQDFAVYLYRWPDNYILPHYVRLYLKKRKGGEITSDQQYPSTDELGKNIEERPVENG